MLEAFVRDVDGLNKIGDLIPSQVSSGFQEMGQYLIRKPFPAANLFIDDAPVSTDVDGIYWEWSPGFYAGQVAAELQIEGHFHTFEFYLDVSPDPKKAGGELFSQYIVDIADYLPELLLGTEPAKHRISGRSSLTSIWIAYSRLKAYALDYINAMRAVCENPISRLIHYRKRLPIHLANRIDTTTIRGLTSNAPLLRAVANMRDGNAAEDLFLTDTTINVPFNETTFDNPANQLMLQQLSDIIRRVDWLSDEMKSYKENTSITETEVQTRIPRRLQFLKGIRLDLTKINRNHPFNHVSHRESSVAGINAVSGNPQYAHTHQLGSNILKNGVDKLSSKETHYISPTWKIYETWCFCILAQSLEDTYTNYQWQKIDRMPHTDLVIEGTNGEKRMRLYFQIVCPSQSPSMTHGYYTISKERRPDLVLEFKSANNREYVSLDAKYMASRRSIFDAMSSAHIYRDSVKLEDKAPLLSMLLTPSIASVKELNAEEYIDRYHEGCFEISTTETAKMALQKVASCMSEVIDMNADFGEKKIL